jgi:hypothetical protein
MKHVLSLVVRFLLSFVVMLIAFMGSSSIISTSPALLTPEETSQSGLALLIVSLVDSLALSLLILRSRWSGARLMAAIFLIHFGVETFMSQVETVFFNASVQMGTDVLMNVILSGFLRALIFAPLAVLIWGKLKGRSDAEPWSGVSLPRAEWTKRFALLAAAYLVVYFVAWQSPTVREYYTGTTAILPFHTHFLNMIAGSPVLPLFQLFRGVLWGALALVITWMMKGKPWHVCAAIAMTFAVLVSSGLLFPNPYMPPLVREAHFLEVFSSMLVYGAISGWIWTRPASSVSVLQYRGT